MSAESLDHVVGGALFDFAAFLTGRKEKLVCSSKHNAVPVVDALKEFMELRGIDQNCEPMINLWPMRLSNGIVGVV